MTRKFLAILCTELYFILNSLGLEMTITFQNRDKYLPGRSFVNNTANSIYQCMDICYRFNYCKSVNFVKELHVCVMNLEDTSTLSLIPMVGSIYEERLQFPQDLVPQDCVGHSCPVEDLCVANGTCANWLYVDCGELEDKKAIIEYEYTVGYAEAKFQCKRPLQGQIGKDTFYCLMSGKWSGPNVQCGLYCYSPPVLRPEQEVIYNYVGTTIYANYKCTSYPDAVSTPSCAVSRCTAPDTWVPASLSCHAHDCMVTPGRYYGKVGCTATGRTCQKWNSNWPHKPSFWPADTNNNYCCTLPNTATPWCYTMDPGVRWEWCYVPMC